MKLRCIKGGGACKGSHPLICQDHGCALAFSKAIGAIGGLKSRNQKEAAAKSHTRAAEAKRRATRAAKANGSVQLRSAKSIDTATGR